MSQKIIDHISREFINLSKSDWLKLAADCIDVTHLSDDNTSLKKAQLALRFESEWQEEKEAKSDHAKTIMDMTFKALKK